MGAETPSGHGLDVALKALPWAKALCLKVAETLASRHLDIHTYTHTCMHANTRACTHTEDKHAKTLMRQPNIERTHDIFWRAVTSGRREKE